MLYNAVSVGKKETPKLPTPLGSLIELRFYIPPDTTEVISDILLANLLA